MRTPGWPSLTLRGRSALMGALLVLGCSEEATGPRPVPAVLMFAAGEIQSGTVGEPLDTSIAIFVGDKFGDPVPGVLVRFWAPGANGAVAPVARTTGPDGHAGAEWRLPRRPGSYQAYAAVAGFDSMTFLATARPGRPARLAVVAGDAQLGATGTAMDSALVIAVTDAHDNPVPGARVTFVAPPGSGTVRPAEIESDSLGRARAIWTLGTGDGILGLTVRVDSLPPLRIRATAVQASPLTSLTPSLPSWPDYAPVTPGELVRIGGDRVVQTAPRRALGCWRNALGAVELEGGGCGE